MKLFRVIDEIDGATTREPGKSSTEIVRMESLYAADDISQVWDQTKWIRDDPERTLIGIVEVSPMVTVIKP